MKEIKINIPKGYEIDKEKSTFEHIVFKKIELTYYDICGKLYLNKNLYYIDDEGIIKEEGLCGFLTHPNRSFEIKQLESILALNKLANVAKYLNDGWLPNKTRDDLKWFIGLVHESLKTNESSLTISKHNTVSYSIVYFKSKNLAQQAIDILGEEEIRKSLILNN